MLKRPAPGEEGALTKRARSSEPESASSNNNTQQVAISSSNDPRQQALIRSVKRTSNLEAPIVSLAGAHSAEILSCRFDPTGQNIAACSADRGISLWKTYPPNTNYALLSTIHKAPVLDLRWSPSSPLLYTASADHTLAYTDLTTGTRVRRLRAHREIVNALDVTLAGGTELVATASDDGTVRVWEGGDDGAKECVAVLEVGAPATGVAWSADGATVYASSLDNDIHAFDLRKKARVGVLTGHTDTPCSLALSPSGDFLLSASFSSTALIHDVRPFSSAPNRVHRTLLGAPAGFENTLLRGAWSRDEGIGAGGRRVALGGADRTVTVWDVESAQVVYKLPGHKGTVTAVDFHPREPIILTASKDGTMLLGELEPGAP